MAANDVMFVNGFTLSVPPDAVRSIVSDARPNRHHWTTRPTIVQQRSTLGVYGHVSPPHGFEAVRAGVQLRVHIRLDAARRVFLRCLA